MVLGQNPVVMSVDDDGKGGDRCFWRTKKDASSTREVEDVEASALTMIVPDTDYIYQCLALKSRLSLCCSRANTRETLLSMVRRNCSGLRKASSRKAHARYGRYLVVGLRHQIPSFFDFSAPKYTWLRFSPDHVD